MIKVSNKIKSIIILIILGILPILQLYISILVLVTETVSKQPQYYAFFLASYFFIGVIWGLSFRFIRKHISKSSIFLYIMADIMLLSTLCRTGVIFSIIYFILLAPFIFSGVLLSITIGKIKEKWCKF